MLGPSVEAFEILGCLLPFSACFRVHWPVTARSNKFVFVISYTLLMVAVFKTNLLGRKMDLRTLTTDLNKVKES